MKANVLFTDRQCINLDHVIAVARLGDGSKSRVSFRMTTGQTIEDCYESSELADEAYSNATHLMQCPPFETYQ